MLITSPATSSNPGSPRSTRSERGRTRSAPTAGTAITRARRWGRSLDAPRPPSRRLADPGSPCLASTIRQLAPIGKVDVNRLPHPYREAGQKDHREAHDEEDGTGRRVGELALDANDLAHPAARANHAVEEEQGASDDAGQTQDEPGERVDELKERQPAPEMPLPGIRRQLQGDERELQPAQKPLQQLHDSSRYQLRHRTLRG